MTYALHLRNKDSQAPVYVHDLAPILTAIEADVKVMQQELKRIETGVKQELDDNRRQITLLKAPAPAVTDYPPEQPFSRLAQVERELQAWMNQAGTFTARLTTVETGVAFVTGQHEDLRLRLFGDEAKRKAWIEAKTKGTFPNFPLPAGEKFEEPSPGAIEDAVNVLREETKLALKILESDIKRVEQTCARAIDLMERTQNQLRFVTRLEAFFGPMLEGKNPPLDNAMIATREYVDNGIATLSRAINAKVADAVDFFTKLGKHTIGMADGTDTAAAIAPTATPIDRFRRRLELMWSQERRAIESANAGRDRLRSLFHAITGKGGGS